MHEVVFNEGVHSLYYLLWAGELTLTLTLALALALALVLTLILILALALTRWRESSMRLPPSARSTGTP